MSKKKIFIYTVTIVFVVVNVLAYMQADAMLNFVGPGQSTPAPEALSGFDKIKTLVSGVRIPKPLNRKTPQDDGLSYETVRFPSASGYEIEGWYIPADSARYTVLLLHGYKAGKASLLPLARHFHRKGYDAFLIDFYGSGGSAGQSTTIGCREGYDVIAAIDYIRTKKADRGIFLYGVSMGGAAALKALSLEDLDVRALFLESVFDNLLATVKNRFAIMDLPSFPLAEIMLCWGSLQKGFNAFSHNPAEYARKVTCPTLVLHGGSDRRVTGEEAINVFNNLSADKQFVSYKKVRHRLFVNAVYERWAKDVDDFLKIHGL